MNKDLRQKLNMNQWKNRTAVIDWFKNINYKRMHKFAIFDIDIKDFYLSMKESLLKQQKRPPEVFYVKRCF